MTNTELRARLRKHGIEAYQEIFFDGSYVCPSREWLTGVFSETFRRNLRALGLDKWRTNSNDCDKFARLAWALASINHARTSPDSEDGLGFGMFGYKRQGKSGHEINIVDVGDDIVFWEPQNQQIVTLTPEEKDLCLNALF